MDAQTRPFKLTNLPHWLKTNWLPLLFFGGLVSAFIFLRSSPTGFSSPAELDQRLATGPPTVIEFYSNF